MSNDKEPTAREIEISVLQGQISRTTQHLMDLKSQLKRGQILAKTFNSQGGKS